MSPKLYVIKNRLTNITTNPINDPQQSPDHTEIDAAPLSLVYPFIFLLSQETLLQTYLVPTSGLWS